MASKNEKAAKKLGISLKEYKALKYEKEDKKKSSKDDKKFIEALKKRGAYDAYKRMDAEQQEFQKFSWATTRSDAKEDIKLYEEALKEAEKQADPYWKSYLIVAQDQVKRAVEDTVRDANTEIEKNQRLIDRLKENLSSNKDFLSLEQQADLATLARNYEANQEQVIEGAAESGLTFSTKRKLAEQRLAEENTGMVESTTRKYNKQMRDLEEQASSGSLEAQEQIKSLQQRMKSQITDIGRTAEAQLGTKNLPTLEGYTPLKNISGQLYEDKTKDIAERQATIFAEKSRESLAF